MNPSHGSMVTFRQMDPSVGLNFCKSYRIKYPSTYLIPLHLVVWFVFLNSSTVGLQLISNTNTMIYLALNSTGPLTGTIKLFVHVNVIKWKLFPRYWPFVWGIHRSPVNSPHKGQWRGALMFSLICAWINSRVNNREAGDLRHHRAHYDVVVM